MGVKSKEPIAGIVALSAVITCAVLAGLVIVLFRWGFPVWNIDASTIYTVAVRLFPVLVGLVMLFAGVIVSLPHSEQEPADDDDLIKTTAATEPLGRLPDGKVVNYPPDATELFDEESSMTTESAFAPKQYKAPEPVSWKFEFDTVQPYAGFQEQLVEDEETVPEIEEPREMSQSIPVWEKPFDDAFAIDDSHSATRAITFSDYPYQIVPGSIAAELLEPIPQTPLIFDERISAYEQPLADSFENRLDAELSSATENGYELSLGVINLPLHEAGGDSVDARSTSAILEKLGDSSYFYSLDENRIGAVMPFYGFKMMKRYFAWLLERVRKTGSNISITVGYSSLNARSVQRDTLVREASMAAHLASQQGGFTVIGFDTETDQSVLLG